MGDYFQEDVEIQELSKMQWGRGDWMWPMGLVWTVPPVWLSAWPAKHCWSEEAADPNRNRLPFSKEKFSNRSGQPTWRDIIWNLPSISRGFRFARKSNNPQTAGKLQSDIQRSYQFRHRITFCLQLKCLFSSSHTHLQVARINREKLMLYFKQNRLKGSKEDE